MYRALISCKLKSQSLIRSSRLSSPIMRHLSLDAVNPAFLNVQYAVRGELAIKAEQLRDALANGDSLPFDRVISSNIGNPQQKGLDQPPISFTRQVVALMEYPPLAQLAPNVFPADVKARAAELQREIGSVGAYSHSQGVPFIRKNVAKFIAGMSAFPPSPSPPSLTQPTPQAAMAIHPIPIISSSPLALPQVSLFLSPCSSPPPSLASSSQSLSTLFTPPLWPSTTASPFRISSTSLLAGQPLPVR
jgi:hypothetical protein